VGFHVTQEVAAAREHNAADAARDSPHRQVGEGRCVDAKTSQEKLVPNELRRQRVIHVVKENDKLTNELRSSIIYTMHPW
jgi:hypothetical protein